MTTTIEITEARRELAKFQRNAKFFTSQYRKFRAQKSDLAGPYKIMAKHAQAQVRNLKRYIKESEDLQERIDEVALRINRLSGN